MIDTYTKRIFTHIGVIHENAKYDEMKELCESSLKKTVIGQDQLIEIYQEYHALLVEHAKRYYRKKPYGQACWLKK